MTAATSVLDQVRFSPFCCAKRTGSAVLLSSLLSVRSVCFLLVTLNGLNRFWLDCFSISLFLQMLRDAGRAFVLHGFEGVLLGKFYLVRFSFLLENILALSAQGFPLALLVCFLVLLFLPGRLCLLFANFFKDNFRLFNFDYYFLADFSVSFTFLHGYRGLSAHLFLLPALQRLLTFISIMASKGLSYVDWSVSLPSLLSPPPPVSPPPSGLLFWFPEILIAVLPMISKVVITRNVEMSPASDLVLYKFRPFLVVYWSPSSCLDRSLRKTGETTNPTLKIIVNATYKMNLLKL